jgi:hypothetical protein
MAENSTIDSKVEEKEMDVCPKCGSIFIEYDKHHLSAYCLVKACFHRWKMDRKTAQQSSNVYLRSTAW